VTNICLSSNRPRTARNAVLPRASECLFAYHHRDAHSQQTSILQTEEGVPKSESLTLSTCPPAHRCRTHGRLSRARRRAHAASLPSPASVWICAALSPSGRAFRGDERKRVCMRMSPPNSSILNPHTHAQGAGSGNTLSCTRARGGSKHAGKRRVRRRGRLC